MPAEDYKTLVDQAEAEYVAALKGTLRHLEAGKNLIGALNTKIYEITDLLGGTSYYNANSPDARETMWNHFNARMHRYANKE
jgi:hypothetical protein